MTTREAAGLYGRAGLAVPVELAGPAVEKVRNTRRKMVDGILFRSTLEADVYQVLRLHELAGAITSLRVQHRFELQPRQRRDGKTIRAITYTADFSFRRKGRLVVVDAKGWRMDVYKLKRKLFLARYPGVAFEEWNRNTIRTT